ncbi:toxin [Marivirga lumbricoides]|uniref:Toxin n=1 Tax=Marivirga lumbricoides TaxID=1046115 RepID=A0A2T4DW60_9BACT|nr:toxin [Marivirga lumbricoides]
MWGVLFLGRDKNLQTLATLEITPIFREKILYDLEVSDYIEGPLEENLLGGEEMWVFGREIKKQEVYIKITLGKSSSQTICISFHIAEHPMKYPLKQTT